MTAGNEIESTIRARLDELESEHEVTILFAVESGSRAWGFASPDSDYDVRFVYKRPVRDYLRVDPPRDVIELPVTATLDINGWDLFKALNLFCKSNPPLFEWLFSPIVYREAGDFAETLRNLARTHYSPKRMSYHYLNMARNNYRLGIEGKSEVSLKKYLYALRPLICIHWIEQRSVPPPTSLWETLKGIDLAADVLGRLTELMQRKSQVGELGLGPADALLSGFIEQEMERIAASVVRMPDDGVSPAVLNPIAWKALNVSEIAFTE